MSNLQKLVERWDSLSPKQKIKLMDDLTIDAQAMAKVASCYPTKKPEEIEATLRRRLAKGIEMAGPVILYRAALRGEDISIEMLTKQK